MVRDLVATFIFVPIALFVILLVASAETIVAYFLLHCIPAPATGDPVDDKAVAVSCRVAPRAFRVSRCGVTIMLDTDDAAATTERVADPVRPSIVAVIVAAPAEMPLATPAAPTVATAVFDDCHVTARPVMTTPFASNAVAVNVTVCPTWTVSPPGVT